MKSTVSNNTCSKKTPFPKLMISDTSGGLIVLFKADGKGCVVSLKNNTFWHIGDYSSEWFMPHFRDFTGSVCLEND